MELTELFEKENIDLNFNAENKFDALKKLAELICFKREYLTPDSVFNVLKEREELGSTGIGHEVAIPHGKMNIGTKIVGALAICREGIDFDALDKKPVKIFITLLAGKDATSLHLKILAKISRILMNEQNRELLLKATSFEEVLRVFEN